MAKRTVHHGTKNGTAKKVASAKAPAASTATAEKQPPPPPPKLSGEDLLKQAAIPLEDEGTTPAAVVGVGEPPAEEPGDAPLASIPAAPNGHLGGWRLVESSLEAGIETREFRKPVEGGYLCWISRSKVHSMAGRSIGADAICFVPVPPED